MAVLIVVVIVFCCHASDKFQEAIWRFFLHCLYLSSMLFLTTFGEVMFHLMKINWKCVFILIKLNSHMAWILILKLSFFGLYICLCEVFENWSIRLSNGWNHFYETTDHLQQFRADKFSTFFKSEASTFSLAS